MADRVVVHTGQAAPWPRRGIFKVLPEGPWFVPSITQAGCFRRVNLGQQPALGQFWLCSCPAGQSRGLMSPRLGQPNLERACRHVRDVARAEEEDGYQPRPLGQSGDLSRFTE